MGFLFSFTSRFLVLYCIPSSRGLLFTPAGEAVLPESLPLAVDDGHRLGSPFFQESVCRDLFFLV